MVGINNYTARVFIVCLTAFSVSDLATKTKNLKENRSGAIREIQNVEEFYQIMKDNKQPKVLKFFSPSCPHCIKVKPIVEKVAQDHDAVLFLELNAKNDAVDALFDTYHVNAYPTFVFLHGSGKIIDTHEGGSSKAALDKKVTSLEKTAQKS